jgi:hypothetical protein
MLSRTCLTKICDIEKTNYGDLPPEALPHRHIRVACLLEVFKKKKKNPQYFGYPQVMLKKIPNI